MLPILVAIAICYVVGQMFPGHEWLASLTFWGIGWLVLLAVELALRSSILGGNQIPRACIKAQLFLGITMWPSFLQEDGSEFVLRLAVAFKLKPAWMLERPEDNWHADWKLKSGKLLSVSAFGTTATEPVRISLDPGALVAFVRARMTAPEKAQPTEWMKLAPMSQEEWCEQATEEADLQEPPTQVGNLQLKRGRYVIEFRVDHKKGSEEFSGLDVVLT